MAHEIDLGGTIYISSKRAATLTGYTQDYIGQLARSGAITAQRVSGLWYIVEESLRNYKAKADEFKPTPPPRIATPDLDAAVSFDGKDYISAQRAAKVTGYNPDYVSQLARSEKIVSRQIGNRWYVDREGIVAHKKHNDSLLAAVQAESVGLGHPDSTGPKNPATNEGENDDLHFNYVKDDPSELMPAVDSEGRDIERRDADSLDGSIDSIETASDVNEIADDEAHEIPIRVLSPKPRSMVSLRPTISESMAVSAMANKAKSKKSPIYIGITAILSLVLVLAGASGYLFFIKNETSTVPLEQALNANLNSITPKSIVSNFPTISVPDSIQGLVSKELYYKRQR